MAPPDIRRTLRRAKVEADAGRRWRAKEILQGSLAHERYALDPEVLEAYGALLDSLGDRFHAGKYLFLSGRREDAYAEPIQLFLHRTRRADIADLIARFPAAIRHYGLGHLPDIVRAELERRGADPGELQRREPLNDSAASPDWQGRLIAGVVLGSLILILVTSFAGCVAIVRWAF